MKTKLIAHTISVLVSIQVVLSIIVVVKYNTIPLHWDISGEIDYYGSSYNIFILTSINIVCYIILRWLGQHPESCNFPRPFKNREVAFRNMSILLKWVELYVCTIFLYLTLSILCRNMCILIIYLLIAGLIYTSIAGIIKLYKS